MKYTYWMKHDGYALSNLKISKNCWVTVIDVYWE